MNDNIYIYIYTDLDCEINIIKINAVGEEILSAIINNDSLSYNVSSLQKYTESTFIVAGYSYDISGTTKQIFAYVLDEDLEILNNPVFNILSRGVFSSLKC